MAVRLQIRNDTAANWTAANPVLATGELAIETDTRKFKIGNGTQAWNSLLYATQGEEGPQGPKGDPITVDSSWFDASGNTVIKFSDSTEVIVAKGTDGADGDDGTSVTVTSSSYDANGNTIVYFSDGSHVNINKGKDGKDGADGSVGYTAGDHIEIGAGNVLKVVGVLPVANGTLDTYTEKLVTVSASGGAIDLSAGNTFVHTPSGDRTYAISNTKAGAHSFTLIINIGATLRALTFPSSIKWAGGEAPDMSEKNKTYVLTFLTVDSGSNWLGMSGGMF